MRRYLLRLMATVASVLAARGAQAQRAGTVLALPASARAAGAADAAPLATGASALFYGAQNLPAERSAAVSAGTWIGGAQFATAAVSSALGPRGAWAIGVQSLDYGSTGEIVADPLTGGTRGTETGNRVGASELAVTAGVSHRGRAFRQGLSLAYVHAQVADLTGSVVALSTGAGLTLRGWDLEWAAQHAGNTTMKLGRSASTLVFTQRVALQTPGRTLVGGRWVGLAEWRDVRGEGRTALVGAEGTFVTAAGWQLAVRGAAASHSVETARDPWSVGGSAQRGAWSLDYAYQGFGALGAVHRMGVTWRSRGPRSPSH